MYTTDIGVLVAMLDYGTQADILKGNLLGYKGAIFENLMADFLCKSGQKLYYFHKDSGLELDLSLIHIYIEYLFAHKIFHTFLM